MPEIYKFEDFELDTAAFRLSRRGVRSPIEPLVLDLLVVLLRNAGQLVTRDHLVEEVWQGRFVSESTISTAVKSARKALGDSGGEQRFIKTIHGRGFSFAAEVEGASPAPSVAQGAASPLEPALYVRRVALVTETDGQKIAKVLDARIRTVLNRIPILRIVAPFREADEIDDPREFRRKLGVTLILDLSLIVTEDAVQAEAVLSETSNGGQLWARSFAAAFGPDAPAILLEKIVARAEPAIVAAMMAEMKDLQVEAAQPLVLQAVGLLSQKGWHRETFEEAQVLLEKAITLHPDAPLAHAHLALLRALGHRVGILRDDPELVQNAISSAERALNLENQDSLILGVAGCALADVGELGRAIPILEKSVDADPHNGHAKTALGSAFMLQRRFDEAVEMLEDGMRISPADNRLSVWGTVLALAQLARGNPDEARRAAESARQEDDRLYMPRLALAGIELAGGATDAAAAALKDCLRTRPELNEEEVHGLLGARLGAAVWQLRQAT